MKEDFPIKEDLLISAIFSIVVTVILFALGIKYLFDSSDFSIFITVIGIILGVLFTVLALLYAFEENIKNNILMKELIQSGKYKLIYPIFINSISSIFYSLVLLCAIYFFRTCFVDGVLYYVYFCLIFFALVITVIRAYRCFFIFSLLQTTIKKEK